MKPTKISDVYNYLSTGREITSMQAFVMFKATRLSAIIHVLRKRGHNIVSNNRVENGVRFSSYQLIPPDLK